jgi:hypothetical protein
MGVLEVGDGVEEWDHKRKYMLLFGFGAGWLAFLQIRPV